MDEARNRSDLKPLWTGAWITTIAVGLFPRLNAVINEEGPIWQLDPEARVLLPLILIISIALFFFLGRWAWRDDTNNNRPAKVALVCGVLSLVGVVGFFLSLPIMLGGFAATLGIEGRKRAPTSGRSRHANAGLILGAIGFVTGAAIWLLAGSI